MAARCWSDDQSSTKQPVTALIASKIVRDEVCPHVLIADRAHGRTERPFWRSGPNHLLHTGRPGKRSKSKSSPRPGHSGAWRRGLSELERYDPGRPRLQLPSRRTQQPGNSILAFKKIS